MSEYFETEQTQILTLEYTIEPFIDSLEERGAGPRETLELMEHFESVFEEQLTMHVETLYSDAYEKANPDGADVYLKEARFNPVNEGGYLRFKSYEEPDSEDLAYVRESLEPALNHTLGMWARSSTGSIGDRLEGYAFRPTYRWDEGQLVIDEDDDGSGPVMTWIDTYYGNGETGAN